MYSYCAIVINITGRSVLLFKHIIFLIFSCLLINIACALPKNFVYLKDIAPDILQDMRYAGSHNFVGRPIRGYEAKQCILTKVTALTLATIQQQLKARNLSLKVYDCYRPQMAVADFMTFSQDNRHQEMKKEFYPFVDKADLFKLGYVAARSGHSRGSTVDLTIVPISKREEGKYFPLIPCTAPYGRRYQDNSLDMGSGFDCFDKRSHYHHPTIIGKARQHRAFLRALMMKNGFTPYAYEWWHFTLKKEPYPYTYFNFKVR